MVGLDLCPDRASKALTFRYAMKNPEIELISLYLPYLIMTLLAAASIRIINKDHYKQSIKWRETTLA